MTVSQTGIAVLLLWIAGKGLAFGKDLLVSYHFGASHLADAYFVASNVPALVYAGLYATVPLVLLPQYTHKLIADGIASANRFVSAMLNAYGLGALLLSAAVYVLSNELVFLLAPALDAPTSDLAASLTRIFAITFLFSMVSAVLTCVQLAHGQVVGTQLIPIVNNGIFIVGVYLFAATYGIHAAAVAATAAWVLQTPLQWLLVRARFTYTPFAGLSRSEIAKLLAVLVPGLLSVSIESLNVLVSIFFGSRLSEGTISAIAYAARLQNLGTGLFLVFTTSLLYPALSRKVAEAGHHEMGKYLRSATRSLVLIALPMSVVVAAYGHEIVEIVFERGAFGTGNTLTTASILMVLAAAIPFVAVRDLLLRAIYALQAPRYAAVVSLGGLASNVVVSYVLVDDYGTRGLAVALVVSSSISCAICVAAVLRLTSSWVAHGLVPACIKLILLASLVAATAAAAPLETWIESSLGRLIVGTAVIGAMFTVGYVLLGLVSIADIRRVLSGRTHRA